MQSYWNMEMHDPGCSVWGNYNNKVNPRGTPSGLFGYFTYTLTNGIIHKSHCIVFHICCIS